MNVSIPDDLYRRATEIAAAEGVSVDDVVAAAFRQMLLGLERLKDKASRGSYEGFQRVMAKVPAVDPEEFDLP